MDLKLEVVVLPVTDVERARGSARYQLCVHDIEGAHAELVSRGVEVGDVQHFEHGVPTPGRGEPYNSFVFFEHPNGNNWAVQESPLVPS